MQKSPEQEALDKERWEILEQVDDWLELPVLILGFVWLVLLIIELVWGLSPLLETIFFVTWGVFVFDFVLRFFLAPDKLVYLKNNWLTAISLVVPAFRAVRLVRILRLARVSQAARSLRLVQVVGTINRGMRALRASMARRGFGYVLLLTSLVALVGSAGMYTFEFGVPESGIETFGDALWWTAMVMTTLGSGNWPQTAEGRLLGFLLSLYAFGAFGYTTAALATFFIGREAEHEEAEIIGAKTIETLRSEIRALRNEIHSLASDLSSLNNDLDKDLPE